LCNSRCHNSVYCLNKWSMHYVSPMHYTGKRCACFKNNGLCNSRCHNSVNCLNKWSMYYVSPMHYTDKFVVTCIWLFIFVIININRDET
jgi:hypothetical protein